MASRAAKFISAVFASIIAGAPVATMSQNAPVAPTASEDAAAVADDCLTAPKGAPPQGQHWYYRVERGTKRQCWYLREAGDRPSQSTASRAAVTEKPVAQRTEALPPRSLQDARAEIPMPRAASDQDTTGSITPAPAAALPPALPRTDAINNDTQPPDVASRWPDATTNDIAVSSPATPPAASVSARQRQQSAHLPAAAMTLAAADVPIEKPTGSIQMLLLVVLGALGLAGLSGSVIYRFAGPRNPVRHQPGQRRRVNWKPPADSNGPWVTKAPTLTPLTKSVPEPVPVPEPVRASASDLEPVRVRASDLEPAREQDRAASEQDDEPIDIDEITKLLEHLLKEGPRLDRSIAAAGSADYAQSPQGRSGVRA